MRKSRKTAGFQGALFSSARTDVDDEKDRWRTPPEVFDPLNAEFGFGVDTAARPESALCPSWLGPEHPDSGSRDGLSRDWSEVAPEGSAAWANPPYSVWGEWARCASWHATNREMTTVLLVFARTDTEAWWSWVLGRDPKTGDRIVDRACAAEIRWCPGRLTFLDGATGKPRRNLSKNGSWVIAKAPAPSVAIVYRPGTEGQDWPANRVLIGR